MVTKSWKGIRTFKQYSWTLPEFPTRETETLLHTCRDTEEPDPGQEGRYHLNLQPSCSHSTLDQSAPPPPGVGTWVAQFKTRVLKVEAQTKRRNPKDTFVLWDLVVGSTAEDPLQLCVSSVTVFTQNAHQAGITDAAQFSCHGNHDVRSSGGKPGRSP